MVDNNLQSQKNSLSPASLASLTRWRSGPKLQRGESASNGMKAKKILKQFKGIVVSDKMAKTVVVKVNRQVAHPKYGKKYIVSKNYKCHDEKNQYKIGDQVVFIPCRPLSKEKRWRVVKKLA